jgi:hypothetical protein
VEKGRIQFTAEQKAAIFVPNYWWAIIVVIFGKELQIPGCVSEF